jgi:hypothetical protein
MKDQVTPRDLENAGIQYSIDETQANFDKNKNLSNLLDQIGEKCTREVYELLGSKSNDYRVFRQKARDAARTMRPLFTATREGERIKRQFQKMRLAEANEFIKGVGVNPKDVKSILRKYREESRSAIEKTRNTAKLLDADHVPPTDVVVEGEPSPWKYIYPPYWFPFGGERRNMHGGDATFASPVIDHFENHKTGEISCHSQLLILDPGDYAWYSSAVTSAVWISFQMPASGRIDAWSYVECVGTNYSGFLHDEFGNSDADVEQTSRYFMSAGSPTETTTAFERAEYNLLDYYRGGDEGQWNGFLAVPGDYRYPHFVSSRNHQAGEWVLMATGINDTQSLVVNDMAALASISNSWIVKRLAVSAIS